MMPIAGTCIFQERRVSSTVVAFVLTAAGRLAWLVSGNSGAIPAFGYAAGAAARSMSGVIHLGGSGGLAIR